MATDVPQSPRSAVVDLTGLPEPVVKSITQLVESLRVEIDSLAHAGEMVQRLPLRGRFADHQLAIPKEDIDEAQTETWKGFAREFPDPGSS